MTPSRLFWKLFLAFWLATGCSFLIGFSVVKWGLERDAPVGPTEVAIAAGELIRTDGLDAALPLLRLKRSAGTLALYDANQRLIAGAPVDGPDAQHLAVTAPDGRIFRVVSRRVGVFEPMLNPFLIGTSVSLIFSAAVAWYLAQPLAVLSRGFRAVAAGQLATRVVSQMGRRRDEIADLGREFDGMAARLQELWHAQQRLMHDLSHELRSPLARLQVAIGLLRQSPAKQQEMIARVQREAERLESLIEQILTLARLKSGAASPHLSQVDVADLLAAIVEDASFEVSVKHCTIEFEPSGSFVTLAEGELLYRAFENVIRNAVKYSPLGGVVRIEAKAQGDQLKVQVIDDGPGVPEDALDLIFEPFRRLEPQANVSPSGFGLGLALARYAVEIHGGEISALRREDAPGLIVRMIVPKRRAIVA